MTTARYRCAAALAAVVFGLASAGSTVYASTAGSGRGSSSSSRDNGSQWRWQDHRDNRGDGQRDRSFRRDHCCDNNNHNDSHSSDSSNSRSGDCGWLRDHDHERWLQECSN
ncbi:MAG TPA: hypothetical protein VGL20_04970 [Candidatus Dormibacteraeota bacterium]